MSATLIVRHHVADYAKWRAVFDELGPLRAKHGCTAHVLRLLEDANDLLITHDFPTVEQAGGFAGDPGLAEGMQRAGVDSPPRIELFASA